MSIKKTLTDTRFDNSTFWITARNERIIINRMTTDHINNTLDMLDDEDRALAILERDLKLINPVLPFYALSSRHLTKIIRTSKVYKALKAEFKSREREVE